ncbi:carbohydrate ABC transporter permease [Paenibacillus psychroresistens]|uniref:Carbohydrate ABC transporter permease n=1 Tax=Paenibacillus psychroresistens TaxID=1778678 RepID=A0A6B8RSS9_9BACL|nr:carbohydrate ABC transporter permease [Paenibacillus psychroresistens]QGQ99501.1 carbohydrate ABC transporter permease [Paenibacillus psychroresistens]
MKLKLTRSLPLELVLILISLLFLYPIYYLFIGSLKEPNDFYDTFSFPTTLYLGSYEKVFDKINFFNGLWNSTLVTLSSLTLTIIIGSMAGYILARMNERFFRYAFIFILSGMIIPTIGNLIPLFKLAISLHLMNTRIFLVILYTASQLPFATFLYSAFTKSIPRELEESASMDGCGRFRNFWRIIFPLLLPATGTYVITNVYIIWNDFLTPLVFLSQEKKMTLMPLVFQFMANSQSIDYGPVFAASVMTVLPVIVLFLFTQKYMLKGLVVGSVKG